MVGHTEVIQKRSSRKVRLIQQQTAPNFLQADFWPASSGVVLAHSAQRSSLRKLRKERKAMRVTSIDRADKDKLLPTPLREPT
jgi:hypothetical protein